MPKYRCDKCDKEFDHYSTMIRHHNRKFSCIAKDVDDDHGHPEKKTKTLKKGGGQTWDAATTTFCDPRKTEEILSLPFMVNKNLKNSHLNLNSYISSRSSSQYHDTINSKNAEHNKNNITIKCSYCLKDYKNRNSLLRHIPRCAARPLLKEEIEKIENDIKKKINSDNTIINNTINNNTINNINTQNIIYLNSSNAEQLLPFGKEDIEYLSKDMMKNIISQPELGILKLIQEVHFNDDKPQNQNIQMPNKKEPFIEIFNGEKWEKQDKKIALQNIITTKKDIMDDYFDEHAEKNILSTFIKKNYETFSDMLDEYVRESLNDYDDNIKDRVVRKCLRLYKEICKQAELIIINNKKKTNKQIEDEI